MADDNPEALMQPAEIRGYRQLPAHEKPGYARYAVGNRWAQPALQGRWRVARWKKLTDEAKQAYIQPPERSASPSVSRHGRSEGQQAAASGSARGEASSEEQQAAASGSARGEASAEEQQAAASGSAGSERSAEEQQAVASGSAGGERSAEKSGSDDQSEVVPDSSEERWITKEGPLAGQKGWKFCKTLYNRTAGSSDNLGTNVYLFLRVNSHKEIEDVSRSVNDRCFF